MRYRSHFYGLANDLSDGRVSSKMYTCILNNIMKKPRRIRHCSSTPPPASLRAITADMRLIWRATAFWYSLTIIEASVLPDHRHCAVYAPQNMIGVRSTAKLQYKCCSNKRPSFP